MKKGKIIKIDKNYIYELVANYMKNKYGFEAIQKVKELSVLLRKFNLKRRADIKETYEILIKKIYSNKLLCKYYYKNKKIFIINISQNYALRIELEKRK